MTHLLALVGNEKVKKK